MRTGISITAEVACPLHKGASLQLPARDRVAAHGAQHARVRQLGLGGDDTVGDVVVDGRVLLLLDLDDRAILERPLDNVRLLACTFDVFGLVEGRPELGEVLWRCQLYCKIESGLNNMIYLELDEVPGLGERCLDDSRFHHRSGGGNEAGV